MNALILNKKANPLCFGMLVLLWVMLIGTTVYAATAAGTIIKNQASASYKDSFGVKRIATSNLVETVIRQVAALELTSDQIKQGTAGKQRFFSHTIVNTGNGPDKYALNVVNATADDFDFTDLNIYKDDNRDGQPDSFTPIHTTSLLAAGESQSIVVTGGIPASAVSADTASVTVTASSDFDAAINAGNQDAVRVTDAGVVSVSKSLSTLQGTSPDGPIRVRIDYANTGEATATGVSIIDAIPSGMTYIAGSGQWSESGATALTDADPNDAHSGAATSIRYCAYDASCVGIPEANNDADSDTRNQVTAIIGSLQAGDSGYVTFEVSIDSGLAASVLYNTAELEYVSAGATIGRESSNSVPFQVLHGVSVVLNGSSVSSVDGQSEPLVVASNGSADPQAGNAVFFRNVVWNTGNSIDTFDISVAASSFPAGTVIQLLQADAQTPLLDHSGNGTADTGPIDVGQWVEVVLQVILPSNGAGNNVNYELTAVATSTSDAAVSNPMVNRLQSVVSAEVDLTNTAALGDASATGAGPGPEADAVTTMTAMAGQEVAFDLYVNNTSGYPVEYSLSASIHSDFSSVELPSGWGLSFLLVDNSVVTTTGIIEPGGAVQLVALVTLPANAAVGDYSVYFRAMNDRSGATDIKHDQVSVIESESLLLGINQEGQLQAGGSRVYNHTLVNSGDTAISNISLATTDTLAASGWSSIIYLDTDGDGQQSAADQVVNSVDLLTGEAVTLFVKVFAPGTAADAEFNATELTASYASGDLTVTDISHVSAGEITMLKEQALDNGCDGVLDTAYSSSPFEVAPGNNCVSYRLTASNQGSVMVHNVRVADATPTFTSYEGTASCSKTNCAINEPASGSGGEVTATLPQLIAGDSVVLQFTVRVE